MQGEAGMASRKKRSERPKWRNDLGVAGPLTLEQMQRYADAPIAWWPVVAVMTRGEYELRRALAARSGTKRSSG